MPTLIDLHEITVDSAIQQRHETSEYTVDSYKDVLDKLPPVTVFDDGEKLWLAGGFHRYRAFQKAERKQIPCEVVKGTRRDALLYAVGDNAEHGLQRSRDDKVKAVETLLDDAEWGTWTTKAIADKAKVSWDLVHKIREERKQVPASEPRDELSTVTRKGSDGKQYPTTKPKPAAKGDASPEPDRDDPEPRGRVPERASGRESDGAKELRELPGKIGKCIRDVEQSVIAAGLKHTPEFRKWLDATNELFDLVERIGQ